MQHERLGADVTPAPDIDEPQAVGVDDPTAAEPASRFDRQRTALGELMTLAGECARRNAELRVDLDAATRRAKQSHDRDMGQIDEEAKRRRDDATAKADAARQAAAAEHDESTQKAEREAAEARKRLHEQRKAVQRKLEKKHTDETWLIDTMLESASARVHEATAITRKLNKERKDELQSIYDEASAVCQRYGQLMPAADAAVAPAPSELPAAVDHDAEALLGDDADADEAELPQDDEAPATPPTTMTREELPAAFDAYQRDVEGRLSAIRGLVLPRLFVGVTPYLVGLLVLLAALYVGHAVTAGTFGDVKRYTTTPANPTHLGIAAGVGLAVVVGVGLLLRTRSRRRVRERAAEFANAFERVRESMRRDVTAVTHVLDEDLLAATAKHERETRAVTARQRAHGGKVAAQLKQVEQEAAAKIGRRQARLRESRATADAAVASASEARSKEIVDWDEAQRQKVRDRRQSRIAEAQSTYDAGRAGLVARWERALLITQELSEEGDRPEHAAIGDWRKWTPPDTFAETVRFGHLDVDVARFASVASESDADADDEGPRPAGDDLNLPVPPPYEVAALLAFPDHANLLLKHEPAGRDAAVATLRLTMLRLLTSLPPGRVRFTLFDPVGLGRSFAAFMHLADFDDELVGGRVWTEGEAIEQRLGDLTEHMETVIQKYLRNEFETIDDYNAQAGELAEPYRFLVIADLPQAFSDKALSRLASIAASGARCGVHILAAVDTRQTARGAATAMEDLERHCSTLVHVPDHAATAAETFRWETAPYDRLPLVLDEPPEESALTDVLKVVGKAALEAKRVEVDFTTMTPGEEDLWSRDSARDLHVPVGKSGATRRQEFALGRGVAQHALIAGKTGSGKSTLLNGLITNLALWYSPDQLELYLIDFKRGVEFRAYAASGLPHARAVAIESDREFGISVLQRLDEELGRRGDLFRTQGVQDVAGFRKARPGEAMPRVLLVVDEFQELFSEDDRLAQDAALLIDRLVRQGRAFGIHVILGSQTIGGAAGLPRSTLGQMAVRVALQCTEADSQLILGDNNGAARLLSRPGEAIYNDAGGAVEANSPFQVAWLPDELREKLLRRTVERADRDGIVTSPTVVFEGNVAAELGNNVELAKAAAGDPPRRSTVYLGEPVAIQAPTHVTLRRQAGGNLLVIGQQEENVHAALAAAIVSLSLTDTFAGDDENPSRASFRVLDGTSPDSPRAGALRAVAAAMDSDAEFVDFRALPDLMGDLRDELRSRLEPSSPAGPSVYVVVNALQRFRALQRDESGAFGMSAGGGSSSFSDILGGDEDGGGATPAHVAPTVRPDEVLAELLRDGPSVGIHVIVSVDTLSQLERRLSRESIREFDAKVLFQMGANDSSVLIDSPAANRLGFYRGLLASEEQGSLQKFRPYGPPSAATLARLKAGGRVAAEGPHAS